MNEKEDIAPQIIHLSEVVSTNNTLRELLEGKTLPEGSVVYADYQTGGRGQLGNTWDSELKKNLTFSVILYPDVIPVNEQFLISQITALSVKETLDHYVEDITVKWPNDVYWRNKKICGMLIENDLTGTYLYQSLIGIGINLNQEEFKRDVLNPVSLKQITGKSYDREEVLNVFLSHFYNYYLLLLQEYYSEIREKYQEALYHGKGIYSYKDETGVFEASIREIEPTGHLILQLPNGDRKRFAFKEVSFLHE